MSSLPSLATAKRSFDAAGDELSRQILKKRMTKQHNCPTKTVKLDTAAAPFFPTNFTPTPQSVELTTKPLYFHCPDPADFGIPHPSTFNIPPPSAPSMPYPADFGVPPPPIFPGAQIEVPVPGTDYNQPDTPCLDEKMYDSEPSTLDTVLHDEVFDLSQVGTCVQRMEEDHKDMDGVRIVIDKTEIKTEVEASLSKFFEQF